MEDTTEYKNGIAVISCSNTSHEEIIKKILGVEQESAKHDQLQPELVRCPWHIETKYYSAHANLLALKSMNVDYSGSIDAVVIHFDNNKVSSFEDADKWFSFMSKFEPEVLLLCCDDCSDVEDKAVTKERIVEWCLKNHFELVELYPKEDDGDDTEDDFKDATGYSRIKQALLAHSWVDLTLKDPPVYKPKKTAMETLQDGILNGVAAEGDSESAPENLEKIEASASACKRVKEDSSEKIDVLLGEDRWLFDAMGKEDPDSESFESLFQRILSMKEKASSLQGEERKLYAEKVAIEFWRALGGDEEEIAGLDED